MYTRLKQAVGDILKAHPVLGKKAFDNGIAWWGNSLCCGGVEKQLVETAKRMFSHKIPLSLLASNLDENRGNAFFYSAATPYFSTINAITEEEFFAQKYANILSHILPRLERMPNPARTALGDCCLALLHLRPKIFQVWNADYPHIVLAAAIAGVPNIIVAARSMSPEMRYPFGFEGPDDTLCHAIYKGILESRTLYFTANSRAGCLAYERWLGLDPGSVIYTPNVFEPLQEGEVCITRAMNLKRELGIPASSKVIAGLLRFVSIKDPALWVNAAAQVLLEKTDVYTIIAGDGPLRNAVVDGIARLGLADRFLCPGVVENTTDFLEMADIVLLTSHVEGLPNVLIEAQRQGVPVVTTNAGGVHDIVVHGETGFIVEERNPFVIAKYLGWILDNEEWYESAKVKAASHIRNTFESESALENLMALYTNITMPSLPR